MDDFNGMTAALAAKGNCRIQAGSYTGTWTWGEDGKNTIADFGKIRSWLNAAPQELPSSARDETSGLSRPEK